MAAKNLYTVGQLSKLMGVSVRTLHVYDQKGILMAKRGGNGYRFYTSYDAALLQQIIVYRQMDMSLQEIATIVHDENFDLLRALEKQRRLLIERRDNTDNMIKQIEVSIKMAKGEENFETILAGLPQDKIEEWKADLKNDEFGDAVFEAYGKISEDDIKDLKTEADDWTEKYLAVTHLPVSDEQVQKLMKDAYVIMNRMYYDTVDDFAGANYEFVKLACENGRVDKVVVDIYESYQKGMAKHYFDALEYFAEHTLQHDEEAFVHLR
ncbi:MerR family transcriptional regulator [Glaciecola siphonariae]|uniref:MerR family transcriptional regulator n=1 Tax=Glaciecola siphonariae TaxID=521012 RepID=A0ABV9LRQ9_9ALTE